MDKTVVPLSNASDLMAFKVELIFGIWKYIFITLKMGLLVNTIIFHKYIVIKINIKTICINKFILMTKVNKKYIIVNIK